MTVDPTLDEYSDALDGDEVATTGTVPSEPTEEDADVVADADVVSAGPAVETGVPVVEGASEPGNEATDELEGLLVAVEQS